MTLEEAEKLRARARREWIENKVGPCPVERSGGHPSTDEAAKACPFCSTINDLCNAL